MLSDEERKAIDYLQLCYDLSTITNESLSKLGVALNLIEKQSKEIEHQKEKRENQKQELAILNEKQIEFNKLVNTVNSYKGQFKRQQKEIEELKENNKQKYYHVVKSKELEEEINNAWENKIKAKIEEIDEVLKGQLIEKIRVYFEAQKEVLQSLLEKE